jgi:hypothetical protein
LEIERIEKSFKIPYFYYSALHILFNSSISLNLGLDNFFKSPYLQFRRCRNKFGMTLPETDEVADSVIKENVKNKLLQNPITIMHFFKPHIPVAHPRNPFKIREICDLTGEQVNCERLT